MSVIRAIVGVIIGMIWICNGYHCRVSSNGNIKNSDARLLSAYNDPLGPGTQLSYFDTQLKLGAAKLYPGALRHPGGTFANYWSFKNASYVSPCNTTYYDYCTKQEKIDTFPPQTFSASNFSKGVATDSILNADKYNAHSIVFDMNIYTLSGNELLDQFNYINSDKLNNPNAKYYELGNELYYGKYQNNIPNSTYYMEKVQPLIKKIKSDTNGNAKIAAISFAKPPFNNEWNVGVAKFNSTFDAVTIHDYSCGTKSVQNLSRDDQLSYIAIYGQSMIPQYVDYVHDMFGSDKKIWITEFNLGLNSNAFNATIMESIIHAMFAMSYVTASICHSGTMQFLMYHTWITSNEGAEHSLIRASPQSNDINDESFGIMAQIYSHLAWISMIKNDQMTCLDVIGQDNSCPNFHLSVENKSGLKCVFGTGFSNSSDSNSFGFLLQNACSTDIAMTLDLNQIAKIDKKDGVVMNQWTYVWDQIGDPVYKKFIDCAQNETIWDCGPVKPQVDTQNIAESQTTVNITLSALSLTLATT